MPVVVTVVVKIPPNETNASVFADICKPCSNIFNSCKSLLDFICATLPDKSVTLFFNSFKFPDTSFILFFIFPDKSNILLIIFPDKSNILSYTFSDKSTRFSDKSTRFSDKSFMKSSILIFL